MIREEAKLLKDLKSYLQKEKEFSKEEKERYRRLKLKEVRKGKWEHGRPTQVRKGTSKGHVPIDLLNKKREKEQERLLKDMKELKEALEKKGTRPKIINRTLKALDKK